MLAELITMVGTGRVDQQSAQAAIWTRTSDSDLGAAVNEDSSWHSWFPSILPARPDRTGPAAGWLPQKPELREQGNQQPQSEQPAGNRVR
ncbi:MAG UNVERIFIED_CONTAM: hypothetical protein LVR18_42330 [Planctomycetaceae bacterium]